MLSGLFSFCSVGCRDEDSEVNGDLVRDLRCFVAGGVLECSYLSELYEFLRLSVASLFEFVTDEFDEVEGAAGFASSVCLELFNFYKENISVI